jgi:hypothetical protein
LAKEIIVSLAGNESTFSFQKIDRSKLYGRKRRLALGPDGQPCQKAQLLEDGTLLLLSGMTAQGYFDQGGMVVSQSEFVGITGDGTVIGRQPSTLGVSQALQGPVKPEEVFDLELTTIYQLTPNLLDGSLESELSEGRIFRFPFNYSADFRTETAFILKNTDGIFVLVGVPRNLEWSELDAIPNEVFESTGAEDDDLDFEMF